MATDAFGRLRTSEPFTTFNYYPTPAYNDTSDNDVWVKTTNNGADVQYDASNNLILLNTGTSDEADTFVTRTTKAPMDYQPGKSRLIMMSGVMMSPVPATGTQVTSQMGLFNLSTSSQIEDGIWFEADGSSNEIRWCQRKQNGSGGFTETKVAKSSWNIDKFTGTGPSGKQLEFSNMDKNILIIIDQEWLGVGRVRCGFNIGGVTYYAHEFTHGDISVAYTGSPRQRLGYKITSNQTTSPTNYTMKQICSTCISEGGFFPLGTKNSVSTRLYRQRN